MEVIEVAVPEVTANIKKKAAKKTKTAK